MRPLPFVVAAALLATTVQASDLDVAIQSGGSGAVTATAGATVSYEIIGELADADNQGLGLVLFDLSFDGGDLTPADEPVAAPMNNFARPLGMTNPSGFGGTVSNGALIQVGGGQNTIKSGFAPVPNGDALLGIGGNGSPATLVTGQLTAPTAPGTYTLGAFSVTATAITADTTGTPFWAVEPAPAGTVSDLSITVETGCYDSLGFGGPGSLDLSICGEDLTIRDTEATLLLTGAPANATTYLVMGLDTDPTPLQGGILVPVPLLIFQIQTDGNGEIAFIIRGAEGPAKTVFTQMVVDPGPGPGLDFSNTISLNIGT